MTRLRLDGVELSLLLVGDGAIRTLNRRWRRRDKATDVLSFPAGPGPRARGGLRPLGDVVISVDMAKRRAKADRRGLRQELERYLAHGLLHLLGHDHHRPQDARRMATWEGRLLQGEGMVGVP